MDLAGKSSTVCIGKQKVACCPYFLFQMIIVLALEAMSAYNYENYFDRRIKP